MVGEKVGFEEVSQQVRGRMELGKMAVGCEDG
jgi:hypothetical protein